MRRNLLSTKPPPTIIILEGKFGMRVCVTWTPLAVHSAPVASRSPQQWVRGEECRESALASRSTPVREGSCGGSEAVSDGLSGGTALAVAGKMDGRTSGGHKSSEGGRGEARRSISARRNYCSMAGWLSAAWRRHLSKGRTRVIHHRLLSTHIRQADGPLSVSLLSASWWMWKIEVRGWPRGREGSAFLLTTRRPVVSKSLLLFVTPKSRGGRVVKFPLCNPEHTGEQQFQFWCPLSEKYHLFHWLTKSQNFLLERNLENLYIS